MSLRQEAMTAVRLLPEDKLPQLIQFVRFLNLSAKEDSDSVSVLELQNVVRRIPGEFPGKVIMSDDFDDTPDCFKDYL